jgi:hypothetical protein
MTCTVTPAGALERRCRTQRRWAVAGASGAGGVPEPSSRGSSVEWQLTPIVNPKSMP